MQASENGSSLPCYGSFHNVEWPLGRAKKFKRSRKREKKKKKKKKGYCSFPKACYRDPTLIKNKARAHTQDYNRYYVTFLLCVPSFTN